MPDTGQESEEKMKNNNDEFVTVLQGKSVREMAQRLVTGKYTIEKVSLNRYKVIEGENVPGQAYTLLNRRSFVLLDKELYKLQARQNPLAFAIEKALDGEQLIFTIKKEYIDNIPVKLLVRTLSQAKVKLVDVYTTGISYLVKIDLVKSMSERELTEHEQYIADMFKNAGVYIAKKKTSDNQYNPEKPAETLALPPAETDCDVVNTTAKEIPAK